jgi:[acyl-carrier-protein] S-malonyltransferase
MSATLRALVVCPGRGSYGRPQLGSLTTTAADVPDLAGADIVGALDRFRLARGRPTLSELDRGSAYAPRLHVAGEHASLLTFACTAVDVAALDPARVEVVGVTGNSMGFYTALFVAGALDLIGAATLVDTLGAYQADNVQGGQLVYPVVDEAWRPDPALAAAVERALAVPGVYVSIRLGGSVVLGVESSALDAARAALPPLERGGVAYPLALPLHSAFHTPVMARARARATAELAELPIRSPAVTLVGGDGAVHRPWADPRALLAYTLGPQVTEPFDFTLAIATALGDLGPDTVILPGPGDNLGGAIAQAMIACRWRGLRDRADFVAAQASDRPVVVAMSRPAQRALVARSLNA